MDSNGQEEHCTRCAPVASAGGDIELRSLGPDGGEKITLEI